MQLHPELNVGDSGSSDEKGHNESMLTVSRSANNGSSQLACIPEEVMSEGRNTLNSVLREEEINNLNASPVEEASETAILRPLNRAE